MKLADRRELFEIPSNISYLNCAYMAPQLRSVKEIGEKWLSRRSRPWDITPKHFFTEAGRSRELFARLINGEPDGVALVPSVSYGIATAAANVEVEAGQNILVLDEQFPSNYYPWRELAKEKDAKLTVVARPEDHDWTRAVLERIDENTAVVAVPNCHWTDGSLLDLEAVGEKSVGAALVVDAIQSLGAHPFDVEKVRPDFLVASSYKWLLGPYGAGFLYVGERFRDGKPIEHNWVNRERSEDFTSLTDYTELFQPGARRFDVGERGSFLLLPMANEALERILEWGVENVSESIGELTDLIEAGAKKRNIRTIPKEKRARHMIGLRLGGNVPDDLASRLASENVFVSVRSGSIRVSPHLYNDESDIERLFDVLDRLVKSRGEV
ncbi:MAG: aminotransferase class V-fold PLP-dependent enzyme [Rubrobacteraceae bacterium]